MVKIDKNSFLYSVALAIIILATRILFFAGGNTEFSPDTGHYAIASNYYSIQDYAPHLPGYFIYVKMIKLVSFITGTPQSAMKLLSLVFSIAGGLFLFRLASNYTDEKSSLLLTLLIMTNPFVWFFGCNNEIYTFDLFFSAVVILAGMNNKWIYSTPPILALGMGIRLTSGIFLLPVVIYLWYSHNKKQGIYWSRFFEFMSLAVVLLLMWAIPMFRSAGGIDKYFALYQTHNPMVNSGVLFNISNLIGFAWYILLPFGIFLVYFLIRMKSVKPSGWNTIRTEYGRELLTAVYWILPSLLIFILLHYQKGYLLLVTGAMFLVYVITSRTGFLKNSVILIVIVLQTALFLAMPYSEPPDELNFTAKARNFGKFDAWMQRAVSGFSMGAQRISAYDDYYDDIHRGIKETQSYMRENRKYFYLIDPSCLIYARSFQARYPSKTFTLLNNFDMTTYFSFNEYEFRKTTDPYYMIKNSIIITRKSFYQKYLKGIAVPVKEYDTHVFLDGNEINGLRILQLYTDLYDERDDKEKRQD